MENKDYCQVKELANTVSKDWFDFYFDGNKDSANWDVSSEAMMNVALTWAEYLNEAKNDEKYSSEFIDSLRLLVFSYTMIAKEIKISGN